MSKIANTNKKIEETVVSGYKKVEDTVVTGYKKRISTIFLFLPFVNFQD